MSTNNLDFAVPDTIYAKLSCVPEVLCEHLHQLCVEQVRVGDPLDEVGETLERGRDEGGGDGRVRRTDRVGDDEHAQIVDLLELVVERRHQQLDLLRGHVVATEVEHLFGEQTEDAHGVLANGLVGSRSCAQIRDECGPVVGPLMFNDLNGRTKRMTFEPKKRVKTKMTCTPNKRVKKRVKGFQA